MPIRLPRGLGAVPGHVQAGTNKRPTLEQYARQRPARRPPGPPKEWPPLRLAPESCKCHLCTCTKSSLRDTSPSLGPL
eukprot:4506637-Pyramimonas_sp.AAC.1